MKASTVVVLVVILSCLAFAVLADDREGETFEMRKIIETINENINDGKRDGGSMNPSEPESGAVRLVDGDEASGRVEVYLNDQWGTVCEDFWDITDANVVCRQLGFARAVSAKRNTFFGPGVGQLIQMDDVRCTGSETRLVDCAYVDSTAVSCVQREHASVVCSETTEGEDDGKFCLSSNCKGDPQANGILGG